MFHCWTVISCIVKVDCFHNAFHTKILSPLGQVVGVSDKLLQLHMWSVVSARMSTCNIHTSYLPLLTWGMWTVYNRRYWELIFCLISNNRKYTSYIHKIHISNYGTLSPVCMCYAKSVRLIELLMKFCTCDEIFVIMSIKGKKVLHFRV